MAILTGIFRKQTGSIGDMTLRNVGGVTITSEKITRNTSKTFAQMRQRVQMANIINIWRAFENTLHPSFENRPRLTSDYNMFVSANLGVVPIYLTQSDANQGGAVVGNLQITRGSLPSIDYAPGTGNILVTDIAYPSTITDETTLAQFSRTVIGNNADYLDGDQISAFAVEQKTNAVTGVPYVEVRAYEITLNQLDNDTLIVDLIGNPELFSVVDGKIGANQVINGAAAWVHSRQTANGTRVSTQRLVANNPLVATYSSSTALVNAVKSYGGEVGEQFLTPNIDWTAIND